MGIIFKTNRRKKEEIEIMKLKKIDLDGRIIYTLKEEYEGKKTKEAHYKFIRLKGPKLD